VVVSIGLPEGGRKFCAKLPFPDELLYLDTPDRPLYKALALKDGMWSFFSPAAASAWASKDWTSLRSTTKNYSMIMPVTMASATQQGGLYIFGDGGEVLYAYEDPGVGAHAPKDEILRAVGAA
jgi:hypothetical protein